MTRTLIVDCKAATSGNKPIPEVDTQELIVEITRVESSPANLERFRAQHCFKKRAGRPLQGDYN